MHGRSGPGTTTRLPGPYPENDTERHHGRNYMADPDFHACAKAGISALQQWYNPPTGMWKSTGWWNAANALMAVIGYTKWSGDSSHEGVIATTFTGAKRQHANFVDSFYDDNGWWALAWVSAFDLTGQNSYLQAAKTIFTRNTAGWDATLGGGLWWNEQKTYKNAITNELFLVLAARLHQRTPGDKTYLNWALKEWEWFDAKGLIGPSGMVNDGLNAAGQNNGGPTWTYNQGVILGGLAALFEITGDHAYLTQAESIADATLSKLTVPPGANPPGILADPCEAAAAGCDGDQTQFKGIFIRHLYDLWLQDRQPAYRTFILSNASSMMNNNQNPKSQFGLHWAGPFDRADASRQSSALDALNVAIALSGD
jgi:predicted alpha-1,6-mannanase (GH76 family)